MASQQEPRLCFSVEWTDPTNGVVWKYTLRSYPATQEIELVDSKGRLFLRRTAIPDVVPRDLVPGAVVAVFSRQLRIVGCADASTAAACQKGVERTLALIKPDGWSYFGDILTIISSARLQISRLRMCKLTPQEAEQLYAVHRQQPFFPNLVRFMSSGPVVAMELAGEGAVSAWRQLLGPTDSHAARQQAPGSIRARFGTDKTYNCCHGSDSPASALAELAFFFDAVSPAGAGCGASRRSEFGRVQPLLDGTSLCLIKPHGVREGAAGGIIGTLQQQGFAITAAESFQLDREQAVRFHEVYRGVVSPAEFEGMVSELSAGPCLALEVALPDGAPALEPLRTLCGPPDPELARAVRPGSLRARFGAAGVRNAVHCTELAGDAQLEVGVFFL